MLLRMVVGFHFFKEGTDKITSGNFTAAPFLQAATGPWAPHFQAVIEDQDGAQRLCCKIDPETGKPTIDPELTLAIWDDFLDEAYWHYEFDNEEVQKKLAEQRKKKGEQLAKLSADIRRARVERMESADIKALVLQREVESANLALMTSQLERGEAILESHSDELLYWLNANQLELMAYFGTADRVNGFDRDGEQKSKVATDVASLKEQVDYIKQDRKKQLYGWASEVESIWDSYEQSINALAVDRQTQRGALALHRPFKQPNSRLQWINRIIPWFDVIVGVLLIVGLFTRLASLAGAVFLASIIATQPPWIADAQPTILYSIELVALIVIFVTLAGRMGGLDFFFSGRKKRTINQGETLAQAG